MRERKINVRDIATHTHKEVAAKRGHTLRNYWYGKMCTGTVVLHAVPVSHTGTNNETRDGHIVHDAQNLSRALRAQG